MADDPRLRTKEWLDTYLDSANILELDDATPCDLHVAYGNPNYPLKLVFKGTKNIDCLFAIQDADVKPLVGFNKKAYGYVETVTIEIYAVDKGSTVSGLDVVWQAQDELRRISETYPLGSVRTFDSYAPNTRDMGGWYLYSKKCVLRYKRAADLAQTTSTVSYGKGVLDDCTETTLANWVETDAGNKCALTCSNDDIFLLTGSSGLSSAYYSYPDESGANLNLSSTVYTKIRVRWATSNTSIKARVELVFSDANTQTIIDDQSSVGYTTTTATITGSKTIDHIRLYAKTAAGIVYYDFVQIYKGDFLMQNIANIESTFKRRDAIIDVPGMSGDAAQGLGTHSKQLTVTSDLDLQNANNDWQRPQANLSKTDYVNGEVFHEIVHDAYNEEWQWVNIEEYGAFKANVDIERETSSGTDHMITLSVNEYRRGTASGEYETQRFGRV